MSNRLIEPHKLLEDIDRGLIRRVAEAIDRPCKRRIGKPNVMVAVGDFGPNLRVWLDDRLVERSSEHRGLAPWMAHNERKELKDEPGNLPP